MLPQLLELLRSGALSSLLTACGSPTAQATQVESPPPTSPVSHVSSRNVKVQKKKEVSIGTPNPGWTPVKRV